MYRVLKEMEGKYIGNRPCKVRSRRCRKGMSSAQQALPCGSFCSRGVLTPAASRRLCCVPQLKKSTWDKREVEPSAEDLQAAAKRLKTNPAGGTKTPMDRRKHINLLRR